MSKNNSINSYAVVDNSNNPYYREYYLRNAWWGNDWVHSVYCGMCGCNFKPETTGNVYQVNIGYSITFYCQSDYERIQLEHKKRNLDWNGYLYWESLENTDLE